MRRDIIDADHQARISILNDLFRLEQRINKLPDQEGLLRYVNRIKEQFTRWGLTVENPLGEPFSETRTDCEASIAGESTENLVIKEVLQPIIRIRDGEMNFIVQRAVVIVSSNAE
jgi:hypothetical protein